MRPVFAVPLCYFPSLVLFLDNGHDFLLNVLLQLSEHVAYRWFNVSIEALNFVDSYRQKHDVFARHCVSEYVETQNSFYFHMDKALSPLYAEVYNPYRFSELSVMVVDSEARGIDGFEFCRRLGHTMTKKLLLIHPDEASKAREALEQGVIDGYLDKKNPQIIDRIHREISRLQMDYFLSMSNAVLRCLNITVSTCLQKPAFQLFMQELFLRYRITEYYLIERGGSFLLLDEDANPSILMVNSLKQIEENALFASMNGATDELVDALINGEKIPCSFLLSTPYTWLEWQDTLVSAVKVDLDEEIMLTYLPSHLLKALRDRKILSYHRYLNELDAEELSFI